MIAFSPYDIVAKIKKNDRSKKSFVWGGASEEGDSGGSK